MIKENYLQNLKETLLKEKKSVLELENLIKGINTAKNIEEKNLFSQQIKFLKSSLKETNKKALKTLEKINLNKPLKQPLKKETKPLSQKNEIPLKKLPVIPKPKIKKALFKKGNLKKISVQNKGPEKKSSFISSLEKSTLKRLKKKKVKKVKKKSKKPNLYIKIANNLFSKWSNNHIKKPFFRTLERDLIKSKIQITSSSYVSLIYLTTFISIFGGMFIFIFFLFFNIGSSIPFITVVEESFGERFLKVFWLLFAVPVATFLMMYFYPSLEKKSAEVKINRELPFATIHMAAISGSMIEPSKIFNIIISTQEYPYLEKEFTKLLNEINIHGHNLTTALRNVAFNSPSKKLSELLNGLATTIQSGGDLPIFFEKRSQTLLFEHRIEKEKHTKSAETFMDIYISVVIAAPMILMLLLMMMSISGLSWLKPSMITLVMIMGVSVANIIFLAFLHLKGSTE